MTREERAAKRAERLKERIEQDTKDLHTLQAANRAHARAQRDKRRFKVGLLADVAGLLDWDDGTLAGLFQILATLRDCPDPVGVLESLVGDGSLAETKTAAGAASFLLASLPSDSSEVSD
jgi:hypothetical protein